jgi:hypothetical protein
MPFGCGVIEQPYHLCEPLILTDPRGICGATIQDPQGMVVGVCERAVEVDTWEAVREDRYGTIDVLIVGGPMCFEHAAMELPA